MTGSPYLIVANHILPIVWLVIFLWENLFHHLHTQPWLRLLWVPEWNYFIRIGVIRDTRHRQVVLPLLWQWPCIGCINFFIHPWKTSEFADSSTLWSGLPQTAFHMVLPALQRSLLQFSFHPFDRLELPLDHCTGSLLLCIPYHKDISLLLGVTCPPPQN